MGSRAFGGANLAGAKRASPLKGAITPSCQRGGADAADDANDAGVRGKEAALYLAPAASLPRSRSATGGAGPEGAVT